MSEINSFIIIGIVKISKLNFNSRKKVLILRSCLFFKYIITFFYFRYERTKEMRRDYFAKKIEYSFSVRLNAQKFKFFVLNLIFHFLAGSYPIGMIYFSFMKKVIKLPFFITNI